MHKYSNLNGSIYSYSPYEYTICDEYANKVVHSNNYEYRGQKDIPTRIYQALFGKLAEMGAYNICYKDCLFFKEVPDTVVYDQNKKSWRQDFQEENSNVFFHVKSFDENNPANNDSIIVQKNDIYGNSVGHRDKFALDPNSPDYIIISSVNMKLRYVKILFILPVKVLHEHKLFKEPRFESLKISKYAVYVEDIEKIYNPLSSTTSSMVSLYPPSDLW